MRRRVHTALLAVLVGAAALVSAAPGVGAGGGGPADAAPAIALSHANPVLTARALRPGQSVRGSVNVRNAGDAAGRFRLTATVNAPAALARTLVLRIRVDGTLVYDGPFAHVPVVELGRLAPGEAVGVRVSALLPEGARRLGGGLLTADLRWDAAQA
jgi:hypothetical protein